MKITLTINEQEKELDIEANATLLDVLRNAGYYGVKRGCEEGTCCSCVVLIDNIPLASCLVFAIAQEGKKITTIESLDNPENLSPIIDELVKAGAVQCGYCTPAMALSVQSLLDETPRPTEEDLRDALDGHLCRCTGYVKQIEAFQRAADRIATAKGA